MMRLIAIFFVLLVPCRGFAQETGVNKAQVSIPGVKGVLELDVGKTTWDAHVRADGKETQLQAIHRMDNLRITAFLQKVNFQASAENCRGKWWPMTAKSAPIKREELRQYDRDGAAVVEYVIPEFRGNVLHQKSLHAYLGANDLCAEIHLSKDQFVPEDEKAFEEILSTVRLLPGETGHLEGIAAEEKKRYLAEGSRFYLEHNYKSAAELYQRALDLEKRDRTLSRDLFRVLVDNLGMSYGLTKKYPMAKETFEYGISQDPAYPLFYYLMACTYGEQGLMNESIEQLSLAFKYKANVISGESLPDPLKDDSFRKFSHDKRFVDAVRDMQSQ
jgi:tetratricopeptide (TPR) repeat protein